MRQLLLIISTFWFALGLSQNTEQFVEVGKEYSNKGDQLGAYYTFKKAMSIDSSNAAVLYYYGKSLMELNRMEAASRYLFKAALIDKGDEFEDVYFLLAEAYRGSGDYRKARRYYTKALIPYRRDRESYWYKKIDQSKEANSWAMKQNLDQSKQINRLDASLNTDAGEFAPLIHEGKIYFSSLRADSLKTNNVVEDRHYYHRIYSIALDKGSEANLIQLKFEDEQLIDKHLANLFIDPESDRLYFSACDTNYRCEIWSGVLKDDKVVQTKALNKNINFPSANNTQATLVRKNGEEFLIFSSDRPKGFGNLDLWISKKEAFGFDEALNLGATINSQGNEISPYYQDGWLYFSSDWWSGFGGYDIFKSAGWISDFAEPINLNTPINSSADDYYFSRSDDKALLASNRIDLDAEDLCCNDLFFTPYEEEELKIDQDSTEIKVDTIVPDIVTLNKYLPLDLYFHNDEPDPNSRDSTTQQNYLALAEKYTKMKTEYLKALEASKTYVKDEEMMMELESFFENELVSGIEDLEFFTPLLLKSLRAGNSIELSIKGFASSVSEADYNLRLTLRRIESLANYFANYQNGVFREFMNGTAANGAKLSIKKLPFGEFAFSDLDLEDDKIWAVYSPQAAKQRKIELIAVNKTGEQSRRFDNQEIYQTPELKVNSKMYELGEVESDEIRRIFILENAGGSQLDIYNVMVNCECANLTFPEKLAAREKGSLEVIINTSEMKGEVELTLTIVSNTSPNLTNLKMKFSK